VASSIGVVEPVRRGENNTVSYGGPHRETMAVRGVAARQRSTRRDGAAGAGRRCGGKQAAAL
jgi:hypothetical protein